MDYLEQVPIAELDLAEIANSAQAFVDSDYIEQERENIRKIIPRLFSADDKKVREAIKDIVYAVR